MNQWICGSRLVNYSMYLLNKVGCGFNSADHARRIEPTAPFIEKVLFNKQLVGCSTLQPTNCLLNILMEQEMVDGIGQLGQVGNLEGAPAVGRVLDHI